MPIPTLPNVFLSDTPNPDAQPDAAPDNRLTLREARDRALQLSRETDERLAEERRREAAPDDIAILAADLASEPIDRSGCQCAYNEYCPTCEAELAALHAAHDELARDDAAPFTDVWVDAVRLQKRVQELEAQLAAKEQTIADLRDLAYERAPKIAAEELRRQKEEYEAQLAEANAQHNAMFENMKAQAVLVARLRAALAQVEVWMAGDDGPLEAMWDNGDIGSFEDYDMSWELTLNQVRKLHIDPVMLGVLGDSETVKVYRAVLAALNPREGEGETK